MAKTYGKMDFIDRENKANEKKAKKVSKEAALLEEKYGIVKKCFNVLNSAPDAAIIILAFNIDDDGTKRITLRDGSETYLCSTEVLRVDSVEELTETIKELSDNDQCIALKIYGEAFSGFADELSMFYSDAIVKDAQSGTDFANIPKDHLSDFSFEYDEVDNHLVGFHHVDEEVTFEDDEEEDGEEDEVIEDNDFDDGDFDDGDDAEEYTEVADAIRYLYKNTHKPNTYVTIDEEDEEADFTKIVTRLKSLNRDEMTDDQVKNLDQVIGAMEILQGNVSYWRSLIGNEGNE